MQKLNHPKLVKFISAYSSKKNIYILTDYQNGKDLQQVTPSNTAHLPPQKNQTTIHKNRNTPHLPTTTRRNTLSTLQQYHTPRYQTQQYLHQPSIRNQSYTYYK